MSNAAAIPAEAVAVQRLRQAIAEGRRVDNDLIDEVSFNTGLTIAETAAVYRQIKGATPIKPAPEAKDPTTLDTLTRHPDKRIAAQARKVADARDKLRQLVDEYNGKDALRKRLAKLEAEAAKIKAELRGNKTPTKPTAAGGDHACDQCDRTFSTRQGVVLHGRRAHGGAA